MVCVLTATHTCAYTLHIIILTILKVGESSKFKKISRLVGNLLLGCHELA